MTGEFAIAVHALVYLCVHEECCSSNAIAESVCTHPARVRKVLVKLKRSNLVKPKEGAEGGYILARDADKINLKQVCIAVGSAPVAVSWKPGSRYIECPVGVGMSDILDDIYAQLNIACFKKLQSMTLAATAAKIKMPRKRKAQKSTVDK